MEFFEIATLRSYYGALLTKRQNDMLKMHYDEDLSLAEIAEIYGVSRQAVADSLAKGEKSLCDYDAKLGLIAKDKAIGEVLDSLDVEGQNPEVLAAIAKIRSILED